MEKVMDEQSEAPKRRKKSFGRRLLRFILFIILFAVCIAGGMVFGYVYVGKQPLEEAFRPETWRHVFDLVFAP
ncbi:DNA-directed RNA polymerase subunit beta [Saccharibacillus sp. CPCC 101409]|uniref:DNA-directed RNA polymerase subunit beta n=1 Tax=Saccharibacillus sp. CPCC 101409 TaxID=3058041 RepID=UPI002670DB19|nr:DNA-directed RNA polymerase subunit beta [Saccharibacillus sp. CPCC 101409]MDO3412105.1 DNA-directed RNA polymerase subunit beta [Saccharibacillus sp. CPCC 101409]